MIDLVGNVGLNDVRTAWAGAKKIDPNPVRLAGRIAGLGSSELDAGVPTWAWVVVAFGAGALATYAWRDKIADRISEVF